MCLAQIVQPLTKDQLTGLAISMIEGTLVERRMSTPGKGSFQILMILKIFLEAFGIAVSSKETGLY